MIDSNAGACGAYAETAVAKMASPEPRFVVLYRWRIRPGTETAFIGAWSRLSALLVRNRGSLGSRLHCGSDGIWYSYAQWSSAEAREKAFALPPLDPRAIEDMESAIAEKLPEIILETRADCLFVNGLSKLSQNGS